MKAKINADVILNDKDIAKDIEKFAKTCATTIIEEAQVLIKEFAFKEMVGYYTEYDPYTYIRTGQMRDLSYQQFSIDNDNVYEGGIIINSDFTNHPIKSKKFSEEDIYDNVWIKGSHGYEQLGYKASAQNGWNDTRHWREIKGVPDRINRIKRKAYSDEFKNKLLAKGMAKAKSQTYSIINFS